MFDLMGITLTQRSVAEVTRQQILKRLASGRLLGIDRDPEACARARERFRAHEGQLIVMEGNFGQIETLHAASGLPPADGLLADLGLSSMQLEDAARGFSFISAGAARHAHGSGRRNDRRRDCELTRRKKNWPI